MLQQDVKISADKVGGMMHCHDIIKSKVSRRLPLEHCQEALVQALIKSHTSGKSGSKVGVIRQKGMSLVH